MDLGKSGDIMAAPLPQDIGKKRCSDVRLPYPLNIFSLYFLHQCLPIILNLFQESLDRLPLGGKWKIQNRTNAAKTFFLTSFDT